MIYYNNYFGMHLFWWFAWGIMLFWIFATSYNIPGQMNKKDRPFDILKKRFAARQITQAEYDHTKKVLELSTIFFILNWIKDLRDDSRFKTCRIFSN